MARIYNFAAGPAAMPEAVLQQARDEMLDWRGLGMSVMEMSHRSKEFIDIAARAEADLRSLLNIPRHYKVLFLQGGASTQFSMVPMNLLRGNSKVDYICTGMWSEKAIAEAQRYCTVNVAGTSKEQKYFTLPSRAQWRLDPDAAYVHYTPNETIGGVEFHWIPETGNVPLVADMSSTLLSRPLDVTRFGLIYAGAQKNIGPAGLTVVIVREDLIGMALPGTPITLDYQTHTSSDSMYNTPPTYAWYCAGLVFDWLKRLGGLQAMGEINMRKAIKLYAAIDQSGYYRNPIDPGCRSWMNVPFTLPDAKLDSVFVKEAETAGLAALGGHRSVGGMRASLYNAVSEQAVDALIAFMHDFARRHG